MVKKKPVNKTPVSLKQKVLQSFLGLCLGLSPVLLVALFIFLLELYTAPTPAEGNGESGLTFLAGIAGYGSSVFLGSYLLLYLFLILLKKRQHVGLVILVAFFASLVPLALGTLLLFIFKIH